MTRWGAVAEMVNGGSAADGDPRIAVSTNNSARAYRGGSMLGTLRTGDRVWAEPATVANVGPGDLVAFRCDALTPHAYELVHRVVAHLPEGLVTRGDNNPASDPELVTTENLVGRVRYVERYGVLRPVRGGRLGLWRARVLHFRSHARAVGLRIGRVPYRWLRSSGLTGYLWRPAITRVRVLQGGRPLIKYLHRGRTVARQCPDDGRFDCAKPYDLVISRPEA